MSVSLHERLGRKQEQLECLDEQYTLLLQLLAGVVSGEITRDRVSVNLTNRTWELFPEGHRPEPAPLLNGRLACHAIPDDGPENEVG